MSYAKGRAKSFAGVRQAPVSLFMADLLSNVVSGKSLTRKLKSSYSGEAMEIRESGGNTLSTALGYAANGIDTNDANFTAFIGANNGFVRRVFEQVGASNLAALNSTNADQGQYLLNQINSRPSMTTIALKEYLLGAILSLGTTWDIFLVYSNNGNNSAFGGGGKATPENNAFYTTSSQVAHESGGVFNAIDHNINKSNFHTIHLRSIGHETKSFIKNNVLIEYFRLGSNASLAIDRLFSSDASFNGTIKWAEVVICSPNATAAEVQLALNNNSAYYGISPASPYITANYLKLLASDIGITNRDGMQATFDPPQTAANGNVAVVHAWGGWVAEDTPQTKAEHYKSVNGGVSFSVQTAPPFTRRHVFGNLYKDALHWILGGDAYVPKRDVWTYNSLTDTYNELTSNWGDAGGSSDRNGAAFCIHNNKIMMIGGQDVVSGTITPNTTCMQFNESTNQMDLVGTMGPTHMSFGEFIDFRGDLYTMGGGKYTGPPYTNMNDSVHKSVDHGATWTFHASFPAGMRTLFCKAWVKNDKVFFLLGSDISGNNVKGIYSSSDLINWYLEPSMDARHAPGMCMDTINNRALIFAGNKGGTPAGNKDGWEFG